MRRVGLFLAMIALTACNDATAPNDSPAGTYTLLTINDAPLPFTFSNGPVLISDQVVLDADGSYSSLWHFTNQPDVLEQGFWSGDNGLITFNDETDGINYTGSFSRSVLTETIVTGASSTGSVVLVFKKD